MSEAAASVPCLDDEVLTLLLEGILPPDRLAAVHEHLARCSGCRTLVSHAARARATADHGSASAALIAAPVAPPAFDPARPPTQVGDFRILKPLGHGAMGWIYLARDCVLGRLVALKFIGSVAPGPAERQRFLREAQSIARLSHPGIVALHSVGEIQGHPYLVSEYIQGSSLDQLERPIPWQRALHLGEGLSSALAAAHHSGVLHRDIKPANAIVDEHGHVKLLDFGLAKLVELGGTSAADATPPARPALSMHGASLRPALSMTESGALIGTPRYLAPEAWESSAACTTRSDVYALGAVLYELCSGAPPHNQPSLPSLWRAVSQKDARPLRELAPDVAPAFAQVVDRCLQRDPRRRFESGVELHQALRALSSDGARRAAPSRGDRGRRLLAGVAGAAGGALLLGLSLWAGHEHRRASPNPPERAAVPAGPLVALSGGVFQMGSAPAEVQAVHEACLQQEQNPQRDCRRVLFEREQPVRTVRVSPFWIGATEVTIEQVASWLNQLADLRVDPDRDTGAPRWVHQGGVRLVDLYPSVAPPFGLAYRGGRCVVLPGYERHPMTHISWDGAQRFCAAHGMRLPSEAEWEFAARGPEGRRYPWGYLEPRCDGVVFDRIRGGACGHLVRQTAEVGTAPQDRTPQGVADLAGNVMEWVADRFEGPYPPCAGECTDPLARPPDGGIWPRIVRGGSVSGTAVLGRGAGRTQYPQNRMFADIGFRCAKSLPAAR